MLQLFPAMLFQLQLSGLSNACQMWVLSDTSAKLSDVIAEVVQNTERPCQCGFNAENITDSAFQCFPNSDQQVTFRARLHETVHATSVQLIEYIQQWVDKEISIVVQSVRFNIDTCLVAITSFRDPQCPETTQPTSDTTQTTLTMLPTSIETTSDSNSTETTSDRTTTETTSDSNSTETTSDSTTTETTLLYTTVAIVGGVVAVMILAMTFIVIAVLVTKNRKHKYSTDQDVV